MYGGSVGSGVLYHWDCLLAVCEVKESSGQLLLVQHVCCQLHAPHAEHVREHAQQLLPTGLNLIGGGVHLVALVQQSGGDIATLEARDR